MVNFLHSYRLHVIIAFGFMLYLYSLPTLSHLEVTGNIEELKSYYGSFVSFILLWCGAYIGNRYFDFKEDSISQPNEARQSRAMLYVVIGSYSIPLFIFIMIQKPLLPYIVLILLTVIYSTPLIGNFRIKQLPLIKNIWAAGTWWLAVAFFIHFYVGQTSTLIEAGILTVGVFSILLVIELLWDIRDIDGDRLSGNKTIPVLLGLTATKLLILAVLSLSLILGIMGTNVSSIINLIYLGLCAIFVTPGFTNYFYHSVVYVQIFIMLTSILLISINLT